MNQLKKLNTIHKAIMLYVSGEATLNAGEMFEGWEKGNHTQHFSDALQGQILIFQRQLSKVVQDIEKDDIEPLKSALEMYKRDREKLKFNIQNDKINKEFFEPLRDYINSLNDWITVLGDAIN